MVSMKKKRSTPDLTEVIDRRLARIYGQDAEIVVIYPLLVKKSGSEIDDLPPLSEDDNLSLLLEEGKEDG